MDPLLLIVIVLIVLFAVGNVTLGSNLLYALLVVAIVVLLFKALWGERL